MKKWLIEQEPGLAEEIFLDLDPHTGIHPGELWRRALKQANDRCEAVICLLSKHWLNSHECEVEFRYAENLGKTILCARLEPVPDTNITSEWQRCDLFPNHGPTTAVDIDDGREPVVFDGMGLQRLVDALRALGIGAEHFPWPPPGDPDRAPYRGWAPLEEVDAAVFFGRDAQILRGLDVLRGMRSSGVESLFVILGPSGAGKSSFLRAGLLPRLRRDDRRFLPLPIVRPERAVITGEHGLAHAIHGVRASLDLHEPMLGHIERSCHPKHVEQLRAWLEEARQKARARLLDVPAEQPAPTLVLPVDQAEELFNVDAGPEALRFLELLAALLRHEAGVTPAMIVALTIRADRYEPLQTASQLDPVHPLVFPDLKPLPTAGYKDVITGPARRATQAGRRLTVEPALVDRLLAETAEGADALPLLALTLERFYDKYGDDGDLTVAEYESLGGMAQIVQNVVDNLLDADPEQRQAQLDTLHEAFIPWLATINPQNDQPMRRLARWNDLPAASHALIQAMVETRLLVKDTRNRQTVVEVALESLLRQWRELAAWLRDEALNLKNADTLERAAADWQANDRNESWLLEGTRLQEAEILAARPGFRDRLYPTRDYLNASRTRENQRQEAELQAAREKERARMRRRRSRIAMTIALVMTVLVILAVMSAAFAFVQRQAAVKYRNEAVSLRLVAEAQSMLAGVAGGDVRALQQLLAAPAIAPGADTGALFTGVSERRDTIKIIPTADDTVNAMALSPDGGHIIAGGNRKLQIWDADTGQPIGAPLTGHSDSVFCVAYSPDGHRIASGGMDTTVRLWDADTGQPMGGPLTGHEGPVTSVAFSPDGGRIAAGSWDNTVRLWDAHTGEPIGAPLAGEQSITRTVETVTFSPDGRRVASGSNDHTIQLWDAATGQPIGAPIAGHAGTVHSVVFSPDGRRIASGSDDATVRLWDAGTGQPIGAPLTGHTRGVFSVAFSPDGQRIVSGSGDYTLRLWDSATGQQIGAPLNGHTSIVQGVAFTPDGHRIVSGANDATLRVWDADIGTPVTGDQGRVNAVAFSPDGQHIVTGNGDGTVRLADLRAGRRIGEPLTGRTPTVWTVAFSPDGRHIAAGSGNGLRLWDAPTGQLVRLPSGPGDFILSVAFSPEGHRLVTGSGEGRIQLWDADTGLPIGEPMTGHRSLVYGVAFSPDGHRIVSGSQDKTLRLWDADRREPIGEPMTGHTGIVYSVAFSPDGHRIVSGSQDKTLRLWDADTGKPASTPTPPHTDVVMAGHTDVVKSVTFSPDGQRIISGSSDDTVRMWDAATGRQIGAPLTGHTDIVTGVAFSPDGQRIASASADNTVRLWPTPDARAWPDLLCRKLVANMSHKQWNEWVSPDIDYIKVCPDLPIAPD